MLKPNSKLTILDIPTLHNPFLDLSAYSYPKKLFKDDLFEQLLGRAKHEGLTKVVNSLSLVNKKKYISLLEGSKVDWWYPEIVWQQLPSTIDQLMNPLEI